jgi:2',3'-cyclic-nucleotide 2'-phosphodiesterase (5'-nucleotidase family)
MPEVGETPDWKNLKDLDFVLVKVSGADLLTALERSVKYMPRKNANLLHLQGLTIFCERSGETNKVKAATIGAEPIIPEETYRVATTRFLSEGGGAFVGLKSLEVVTKEPHSLNRQIRFLFFPKGKIAPPKASYVFPESKDA